MSTTSFDTTAIPGLLVVRPRTMSDERGSFTKTFVAADYAEAGLATSFGEEYHTQSVPGVVRGMHFHLPPFDHDKLVFCVAGAAFDVVVDLRVGSPTYRQALTFELEGPTGDGLYIPTGCAHGFCSVGEGATLAYHVVGEYSPEHDAGVLWSSINVDWPNAEPIVSARDAAFPTLQQFKSPFIYRGV